MAKYYEDILERLHDNVNSIHYLAKPENRHFISDERWQQIFANLKNQVEKAEQLLNSTSDTDLIKLQHEVNCLKKENLELKTKITLLNNENSKSRDVVIQKAIIFYHDMNQGITQILTKNNELTVKHTEFPEILDYLEGQVLDIANNSFDHILSINISHDKEIPEFARYLRGTLKMVNGTRHAIIKLNYKVYVPEWVCEDFYQYNKRYKVYFLAVDKTIVDKSGEIYEKVALQTFIIDK
ncbi:hypothetical protein [Moraxella lacunata]|uniref:hypothetical protein n=1 Tax=Moraxella lacunata TaxID=477 RepID=UPI0011C05D7F|nr:hypothetical protein [Moraxella lacunata]